MATRRTSLVFQGFALSLFLAFSCSIATPIVENDTENSYQQIIPLQEFSMCYLYEEFLGVRSMDECNCVDEVITCSSKNNCRDADTEHSTGAAESCGKDSIRANFGKQQESIHVGDTLHMTLCSTVAERGVDEVCVEITSAGAMVGPTIDECVSATFGGRPCSCETCMFGLGLNLDCTEHDEFVTSNGCQEVSINHLDTVMSDLVLGSYSQYSASDARHTTVGVLSAALALFSIVSASAMSII